MTGTGAQLQALIDVAELSPLYGKRHTIVHFPPGEFELIQPLCISKPLRVVGNNTCLRFAAGHGVQPAEDCTKRLASLMIVSGAATYTRIEGLQFLGAPNPGDYSKNLDVLNESGIGIDVRGGYVTVEDCLFSLLTVGVLIRGGTGSDIWPSPDAPVPQYEYPPSQKINPDEANADGFTLRACDVSWCLDGVIVLGKDAQTGTVEHNRVWLCRRGITEMSAFGNHYTSNYVYTCPPDDAGVPATSRPPEIAPDFWAANPALARSRPTKAFGLCVTKNPSNGSVFTSNWFEGAACYLSAGSVVVGGTMPADLHSTPFYVSDANTLVFFRQIPERLGSRVSAIIFTGDMYQLELVSAESPIKNSYPEPQPKLFIGGAITDFPEKVDDVYATTMLTFEFSGRQRFYFDRDLAKWVWELGA